MRGWAQKCHEYLFGDYKYILVRIQISINRICGRWELAVFANHISDKGVIWNIQRTPKTQQRKVTQLQVGKRLEHTLDFSKENIHMVSKQIKDAEQHRSLGKGKSKPWDTISYLLG